MRALIIGANGLLARTFIKKNSDKFVELIATARDKQSLKAINSNVTCYDLDFENRNSISDFFEAVGNIKNIDLILFCSSPFEGTLEGSSYEDLNVWSNAYEVALKTSKLATSCLTASGKLIFIGSVVGYLETVAASCVPYSVFKGSLALLAEGFYKEVGKSAFYVNLGGFREEESENYLSVNQVVSELDKIITSETSDLRINVMSENDKKEYLLS